MDVAIGHRVMDDPLADQDPRPSARKAKAAMGAVFFGSFLLAAKEMNEKNHPTISISLKKYLISVAAVSGASEPWTTFFSISVAKSALIVPGSASL